MASSIRDVEQDDDARRQEEDFYLSDIHVEQQDDEKSSSRQLRIEISLPTYDRSKELSNRPRLVVDSDGDFERDYIHDNKKKEEEATAATTTTADRVVVIRIEHAMDTPLSRVGLQMWRASFFLADYLLNNLTLVRDKIVVDLGTGLGLTSFVAAAYARLVFATDLGFVVRQARSNWLANQNALDAGRNNIRFKRLNWDEHETFLNGPNKNSGKI